MYRLAQAFQQERIEKCRSRGFDPELRVGDVLEAAVRRVERYLRRRRLLELDAAADDALHPEAALAASAVER